jgi:signal transduction histidine kinase
MSIKVRLTLVFVGLSLVLLVGTLGYIRSAQEVSRREEFFDRLRDHARRIAGLLGEVEAADRSRVALFGQHSIQELYDEKVLVFDANDRLIYASLDNEPIEYAKQQLADIRAGGELAYRDADGDEVVGVHYTQGGADLVVLASAYDRYGRQELKNLTRTLWISLVLGSLFIFGAGYFYIGLVFRPVDRLNRAISGIDIDKLDERLPVSNRKDEIDRLAQSYNRMLDRLREAFDLQKAFVNNASHELRTPLARMNSQVERALGLPPDSPELPAVLRTLQNDIAAQGSLVESLLLLQRLRSHLPAQRSAVRVDEALFATIDEVRGLHPAFQSEMDLAESFTNDRQLITSINELLLRTAFRNLLVNAAVYAPDHRVTIRMEPAAGMVRITFSNAGAEPLPSELVFEPFFRGAHPGRIQGNGLGLSIVRQVVVQAGGKVRYSHAGQHLFEVQLPVGI